MIAHSLTQHINTCFVRNRSRRQPLLLPTQLQWASRPRRWRPSLHARRSHEGTTTRAGPHLHAPAADSRSCSAEDLVAALALERENIRSHNLTPSSSLSVYRLTALCAAQQAQSVLSALAQDALCLPAGTESIFVLLARLLFGSQESPTPGLAADLLQSLLLDDQGQARSIDELRGSKYWTVLAACIEAILPEQLLQQISNTDHAKVKTTALLLLNLKAAEGKRSIAEISKAGAWLVISQQMLHIGQATHVAEPSSNTNAGQRNQSITGAAADHQNTMVREAEPFLQAGQYLLHELRCGISDDDNIASGTFIFCACYATTSCQLPAQLPSQERHPQNPINRLFSFFRDLTTWIRFACSLYRLTFNLMSIRQIKPTAQRHLSIGSELHKCRHHLQRLLQTRSSLSCIVLAINWQFRLMQFHEAIISDDGISNTMAASILPQHPASQQQRDILARTMLPMLLKMLRQPTEQARAIAACFLINICTAAADATIPLILSLSEDHLGLLLTLLAGNDSVPSRCFYAKLIGMLAVCGDAAVLKRIGDAGAVPYLLALHKQADCATDKAVVLECIKDMAALSPDLAASIQVHGGTLQFLEELKAQVSKLNPPAEQASGAPEELSQLDTAQLGVSGDAITALMISSPAAKQSLLRAGLPATLSQLLQAGSVPRPVMGSCLNPLLNLLGDPDTQQAMLTELAPGQIRLLFHEILSALGPSQPGGGMEVMSTERCSGFLMLLAQLPGGRQALVEQPVRDRLAEILHHGSDRRKAAILGICEVCATLDAAGNPMPCHWVALQPIGAEADENRRHARPGAWIPLQLDQPSVGHAALPDSLGPQQTLQKSRQPNQLPHPSSLAPHQAQHEGNLPAENASAGSWESQQPGLVSAEGTQAGTSGAQQPNQAGKLAAEHPSAGSPGAHQHPQTGGQQPLQVGDLSAGALHRFLLAQAADLLEMSSEPESRLVAAAFLSDLVLDLTEDGCDAFTDLGIVQKGIRLLQQDSELPMTQDVVCLLCLNLHKQNHLPVEHLFEAKVHQQLALMITQSDAQDERVAPAGRLLRLLWQIQPSLVSHFVSDKHLGPLLKRLAVSHVLQQSVILIRLVQDVWHHTAALQAEPLLVNAIPTLIASMTFGLRRMLEREPMPSDHQQIHLEHQEAAVLLLANMAQLPFYRPLIRKAEPAAAVAGMFELGCLEEDGQQQRSVALLACNLVHSLLQGQADGSDGPDAAHNTEFMQQLVSSIDVVHGLLLMCKHGRIESRHGALAVLQLFLVPKIWQSFAEEIRFQLMAYGALPMLFDIATDSHSTVEMQRMAMTCLSHFEGDFTASTFAAGFGTSPLLAVLITYSMRETSESRNEDQRSK